MLIVQKLYVNSNSQYKEHKKMTTIENDRSRERYDYDYTKSYSGHDLQK